MNLSDSTEISSPKRRPGEKSDWYGYYAGYSTAFVRDALTVLVPSESQPSVRVLDPWNGSGTTTALAVAQGYEAVGLDRNPALVVIAKARHLTLASVKENLEPLLAEVLMVAKKLTQNVRRNSDNEELSLWFDDTSAARLRAVERSMYRVLVDEDTPEIISEPVDPSSLSPLSSLFYCALFTVVRQLTAPFRTSNPTWIRGANVDSERIKVEWAQIDKSLRKATKDLAGRLAVPMARASTPFELIEGSVEDLKLDRKADVVLSSPPYCTRIDYVVATKPELIVLGSDETDIAHLRRKMLGTPLTEHTDLDSESSWGCEAVEFMEAVVSHRTKAASTYYKNYYAGYLRGLFKSLKAINGATKKKGNIALVVQDSYFKDVHFDLPTVVSQMGESLGRASERVDFHVNRTKAAINPGSRAYRRHFSATESLVVLRGD